MGALYGFVYTETALKFLEKEVPAKLRGQIKRKIETLAAEPSPPGSKKLRGTDDEGEPVYRIRSGDYRILYLIRNHPSHIVILDIGHRKDIYK